MAVVAVAFHILSNVVRTPLSWWWRRGIMVVAAGASGQRATGYPYYHHHDNATLLLLVTRCQSWGGHSPHLDRMPALKRLP